MIEEIIDEVTLRRSTAPFNKVLRELYGQLDETQLRLEAARWEVRIMRAKLIDHCDGDIMGGLL